MGKHLIHKNSNVLVDGKAKLPLINDIEYGELAINYLSDNETISLKNTSNDIVSFKSEKYNNNKYVDVSGDTMSGQLNIENSINIGSGNTVSGQYSFAQGSGCTASGKYSHAEGDRSEASGNYSHAEGRSISSGVQSHAECVSLASGANSHSENSSNAIGVNSHSEGASASYGSYSHAEGKTHASGECSHSEGYLSKTYYDYCHAEGYGSEAGGYASHAEGLLTKSYSQASHSEGNGTIANGAYSHAEGYGSEADGNESHAEGRVTIASGKTSHAEGYGSEANGECSHSEGYSTKTYGDYSHAEGIISVANGLCSHAEGAGTYANGECSHTEGTDTTTRNLAEHASGSFNISIKGVNQDITALTADTQATLFSIGNGYLDKSVTPNVTHSQNTFEVKWNGDAYFSGNTKFAKGITANTITSPSLDVKQNTLVSGTNIKTINGESLLGSGDIAISGGSGTNYNISDGLSLAVPNILSVKINPSSENYITCDSNGILISGIDIGLENAIKSASFNAIDIAASASTKAKDAAILASSLDASAKSTKAKDDAIVASSLNTDNKIGTAKTIILSEAANDASVKSTKAKDDAIVASSLNTDNKIGNIKSELTNLVTIETNRAIAIETNLATEINSKVSNVILLQDSGNTLHYSLMVDSIKRGDINIPTNQFLKSATYDTVTKELVFIFDSTTGEIVSKIDIADLVDTYTAGNGLTESLNEFSIKLDPISESYISIGSDGLKIYGINKALSDLSTNLVSKINDVNVIINSEIARATAAEGLNATNLSNYKNEIKAYVDDKFNEILTSIAALGDRVTLLENQKTVLSDKVRNIVPMTTAEYDALVTKVETTLYTLTD